MTYVVLIVLAIAVILIFALAAMGVFSSVEIEDDWANPNLQDLTKVNLPLALFGYRRSTVDALLEQLEQTKNRPESD